MLFRLILLLILIGGLAVFTVQNLTPLLPLVFLGLQFPALPLSWWVLGALGAGAISMLAIQVLLGLSNFVTGQTVRSRAQARVNRAEAAREFEATADPPARESWKRQTGRDRATPKDDSAWQDWRGYEPAPPPPSRASGSPLDDWEQPPSDDWDTTPAPRSSQPPLQEREPFTESSAAERRTPPASNTRASSSNAYGYRQPQNPGVGQPEKVVDADYRVIVPPYRPLDEPPAYTPPPPPPPVAEENADDWFEDSSDDRGAAHRTANPTSEKQ